MQLLNDSIRTVASIRGGKWKWLETTETIATVASQSYVLIPQRIRKLTALLFSGTNIYYPVTAIFDADKWNTVIASRLAANDVPLFVYVEDRRVNIAPTPATTTNSVIMRGRLNLRDLSIVDYTTGNILTATNNSTAIVGTGTTWTASMVGRYIRITNSDTANKGDNFWYKIAAYISATQLTLETPYEGTSITAGGAAYKIGEMCPIPEAYDMAPVYRAIALFSQINDPLHPTVSEHWWKLYDGGNEIGISEEVGGLIGQMLQESGETIEGAYIPPTMVRMVDPNVPPTNLMGF